ncbi:protein MAIN-LIKE 1-like [Arachis ipaensis]|uniref:protein MAIN-LIKE 1-like n=1 Tax=Arachis ipaensis TaxID=130454 RepID=UPI000A2B02B9|nr:protein MAIN-LIKE 1-like [Arachis ipaensis]
MVRRDARTDARDPDINRLNASWHIAGAIDYERPRLLLPRRVSHTLAPSDVVVPYLREVGFGDKVQLRDFVFDNSQITAFVELWRPESHTFHQSWGECNITLQDIAYHLGLHTHGEPMGGCLHDFQTWYQRLTWEYVEELLGAKPPWSIARCPKKEVV